MSSAFRRLEVAAPQCVADDFGGEIVALNLDTGFYFSLRDLSSAIWQDLAAGHAVEDVLQSLREVDEKLAEPAARLIDLILEHGLMRPAEADVVPALAMTAGAMAASGASVIDLEVYDDMRDLVMTDPIHEADEEIGWPVRRADA